MNKKEQYRMIPKTDVLLELEEMSELIQRFGRELVLEQIHLVTDELRDRIREGEVIEGRIEGLPQEVGVRLEKLMSPNFKKVVNATGTVLHTNLGRAPLSKVHLEHIARIAGGYSNLEYELEEGGRGHRYSHIESLLCRLTGAEAAMAVNNNAAAVMLILNTMARDKEVIVSRGELVEIGGKFRVPDVMKASGAKLVEVGTTNKTHDSDYEEAIGEGTGAILKVHTSNFEMIGFTQSVEIQTLSELAKKHSLPLIQDIGSGVLIDLEKYGLKHEPTVQESVRAGADVVCFSGDKLLGGPQAGIIVGKREYIEEMKKNQLTRALRIDKFTAAALEIVLKEYLCEEHAVRNIPVLRMIRMGKEELEERAQRLKARLDGLALEAEIEVEPCFSQVGGGSLPVERLESFAVTIRPTSCSTASMEEDLRRLEVPIVVRTANDKLVLDVRTIEEEEFVHFDQLR